MAKYEVMRAFPDYRRGQIIEVADWKNREKLVRTGYLRPIEEVKAVEPVEESPALPAKKGKKK